MSNDVENCNAEEFIKLCFADDVKNFWNKFDNWKQGQSFYTSDIDPDQRSKMLYDAHQRLWKKQCEVFKTFNIPACSIGSDRVHLEIIIDDQTINLGSDSFISIYWHYSDMQKIMEKVKEDTKQPKYKQALDAIEHLSDDIKEKRKFDVSWKNWKKFIWMYLQESNTIGGFILFPRHPQSVNQRRGSGDIGDRFDLTLECIKRYYDKVKSPLYDVLDNDKDFFKMFCSFENYAKFFCLDGVWVKNGQVLSLLNNQPLDHWDFNDNPLPTEGNWWTFYENIMSRLDERNKKIKALIEAKV